MNPQEFKPKGAHCFLPVDMREEILRMPQAREEEGQVYVGRVQVIFSLLMVSIPAWAKPGWQYTTKGRIYSKRNGWVYSQQAARVLFNQPEPLDLESLGEDRTEPFTLKDLEALQERIWGRTVPVEDGLFVVPPGPEENKTDAHDTEVAK